VFLKYPINKGKQGEGKGGKEKGKERGKRRCLVPPPESWCPLIPLLFGKSVCNSRYFCQGDECVDLRRGETGGGKKRKGKKRRRVEKGRGLIFNIDQVVVHCFQCACAFIPHAPRGGEGKKKGGGRKGDDEVG